MAARPLPAARNPQKVQRELEDLQLVMKARNGNPAALDALIRRYSSFVRLKASSYFLVGGDSDDLIPVQALFHSAQGLAALEVPVQWHISSGIGHGIDQEGLRHGGEFLAKRFGLRG